MEDRFNRPQIIYGKKGKSSIVYHVVSFLVYKRDDLGGLVKVY